MAIAGLDPTVVERIRRRIRWLARNSEWTRREWMLLDSLADKRHFLAPGLFPEQAAAIASEIEQLERELALHLLARPPE